jgi:hypothetical protein
MHALLVSAAFALAATTLVACGDSGNPPASQQDAGAKDAAHDSTPIQLDGPADAPQQSDGAAQDDAPVGTTVTDIRDLQQDPSRSSTLVAVGTTVHLAGTFVVTAASSTTSYFFMQNATGPKEYSGIKVRTGNGFSGTLPAIGDTITALDGQLVEETRSCNIDAGVCPTFHSIKGVMSLTIGAAGTVPDPLALSITDLVATPAKYDGLLLSLDPTNLVVASTYGSGTSLTLYLSNGATSTGAAAFMSYFALPGTPPNSTPVARAVGPLDLFNKTWEVLPRTAADIAFTGWPGDGGVQQDSGAQDTGPAQQDSGPSPDGGYCATGSQVVISQVYGAGGNANAVLKNDYVELFNRGTTAVDLTGWSVQYGSGGATGAWSNKMDLSGSIQPGHYLLIKGSPGSGACTACTDLPTPDLFVPVPDGGIPDGGLPTELAMGGSNGRVALVNNSTLLSACPAVGTAGVVDLVGYGTATCFEGAGPTPAISTTLAAFRANAGCTDTNVNSADFATAAPAPRNSATAPVVCGGCP